MSGAITFVLVAVMLTIGVRLVMRARQPVEDLESELLLDDRLEDRGLVSRWMRKLIRDDEYAEPYHIHVLTMFGLLIVGVFVMQTVVRAGGIPMEVGFKTTLFIIGVSLVLGYETYWHDRDINGRRRK